MAEIAQIQDSRLSISHLSLDDPGNPISHDGVPGSLGQEIDKAAHFGRKVAGVRIDGVGGGVMHPVPGSTRISWPPRKASPTMKVGWRMMP